MKTLLTILTLALAALVPSAPAFAAGDPIITGIAPNPAPAGGKTIISGSGFSGTTDITFDGVSVNNQFNSTDSAITVTIPPGTGTVQVQVTVQNAFVNGGNPLTITSPTDFTYTTAPEVTFVNSNFGSAGGGETVVISGAAFSGATSVKFGTTEAASFTVDSATQITAVTPAHATGSTQVSVTTPNGPSIALSTFANYFFTAPPQPSVTSISPSSGGGGTSVSINGTGFGSATAVTFGSTAATSFTVNSATEITATAPAGSGVADVTVTTAGGTSATSTADQFTYVAAPTISSISPSSGPLTGGNSLTITGTGFTGASSVSIAPNSASFTVDSDTQITATAPAAGGPGSRDVSVTTPGGTATASFGYFYFGKPAVTSLAPASGPGAGGTSVTIEGSWFTEVTAVNFGSVPATSFSVIDSSTITAVSPAGSGTANVSVTSTSGTSVSSADSLFTYIAAPTVTETSPLSGSTAGGTVVTLTGTGFNGATAVNFGATDAAGFTVDSDTSITATSPAGSGTIHITVTAAGGTSAETVGNLFSYVTPPQPTVTGVSPDTGSASGGTTVTITGTGFTAATAVTFGSTAATSFTVNSATEITATAPAGSGVADVTVTTAGGTSATSTADQFTYAPVPSVDYVSPSYGAAAGGESVTVVGTGFTGATAVKFGTEAGTDLVVNSDFSITVTTPAGSAGSVHVTVTGPGGTSAEVASDQFTYNPPPLPPPLITSITPSSGPSAGGTSVSVTGTNFTGVSSAKVGGTTVGVTVNSDTSLTLDTPGGSGTVNIILGSSHGTSTASSADEFTYYPPPSVSSLSPSSGPESGGTSVNISGTDFTGASAVKFGTADATEFTVNNSTSITATSPGGTGDVVVTVTHAAGGTSTELLTFTYLPPPTVTAVTPNVGVEAGGNSVLITGTGLTAVTSVKFGTVEATGLSHFSDTIINVTTPPGTGAVHVTVTSVAGTSAETSADLFTYQSAPTITAISPNGGPQAGGTSVTITGTNFANVNEVGFGPTTVSYVVNSPTEIVVTSPPGSGASYIYVETAGGSSLASATGASNFTYYAAPTVTGIGPTSGSESGGTTVTITGTNLSDATAVKFGTTNATGFTVNSPTSITATSPAGVGTVDVTVTTPGGTTATSAADQFTYDAPPPVVPAVTGISPDSGPEAGGTVVTITGSGFTGATAVSFGATTASFSISSDSVITATSPAGAGTVDVTVTAGSETSVTSSADEFTYTTAGPGPDPDSVNAEAIAITLTPYVAQLSNTAIIGAVQFGIGVGLSGGNTLDLGPQGLGLAYAPDTTTPAEAAANAVGNGGTATSGPLSIWLDATGSGLIEGLATGSGWQVNVTGGLGYRVSPDVVVGLLGGYESFAYDSDVPDGRLEGVGYTGGVYAGARSGGVMTDLAIAYTLVGYDVESGLAEGSFDASRILISGGLSGMFELAGFEVMPSAHISALWEGQGEWTDSLGGDHGEREFLTARISLGGAISRALPIGDDVALIPSIGAYADYQGTWDTAAGDSTAFSGRVTAGVAIETGGSARISVDGDVSGLGTDMPSWSVTGRVGGSF